MDDSAPINCGLNINKNDLNPAKTDENANLTTSFDSPVRKLSSCSLESEYELVSDITIECSENEECVSEIENTFKENQKYNVKELDSAGKFKIAQVDELSDADSTMDEDEFVIVDDDFNEKSDSQESASDAKQQLLSDDDFEMEEIMAEFAEEEKKSKNVVKLSDGEDEIDNLLDEFVETQVDGKKSDVKVILSSESEDEMEDLLEEFSKENVLDGGSAQKKVNNDAFKSAEKCKTVSDESKSVKISLSVDNSKSSESASLGCPDRGFPHNDVVLELVPENTKDIDVDENDCIIVCDSDDKSDCSSIVVIEDLSDNENDTSMTIKVSEKNLSNEHSSTTENHPVSSNEVESQMINFEDMVVVDEVLDNSDTDISRLISGCTTPEKSSLPRTSETSILVSCETKSNENNLMIKKSIRNLVNSNNENDLNERPLNNEKGDCDLDFSAVADEFSKSSEILEPTHNRKYSDTNEKVDDSDLDLSAVADEFSKSSDISEPFSNEIISDTNEKIDDSDLDFSAVADEFSKASDISEDAANSPCISAEIPSISDNLCIVVNESKETSEEKSISDNDIQLEISAELKKGIDTHDVLDSQSSNSSLEVNQDDPAKTNTVGTIPIDTTAESTENVESNKVTSPAEFANDNNETLNICENSEQPIELEYNIDDKNNSERLKKVNDMLKAIIEDIKIRNNSIIEENPEMTEKKLTEKNATNPSKTDAKPAITDTEIPSTLSAAESEVDETKKRKLEDTQIETDAKKQKIDDIQNTNTNLLNGRQSPSSDASSGFGLKNTGIEELASDVTVADCTVIDKTSQFLPLNLSDKFMASKKVLDEISLHLCGEVVKECFKNSYDNAQMKVDELKKKYETLSKSLESFRAQANEFHNSQRRSFQEHDFKPKAHTRTVGVNVKIYRESELKQALTLQKNENKSLDIGERLTSKQEVKSDIQAVKKETKPVVQTSKDTTAKVTTDQKNTHVILKDEDKDTKAFQNIGNAPNTQMKESFLFPISPQQVKRQLLPRIITQSNRPGANVVPGFTSRPPPPPNVTVVNRPMGNAVHVLASRPPPPPNVTVSGNRLIPFTTSQRSSMSSAHSVVLVPSSSITAPARNSQYIDLTKEELKVNPNLGWICRPNAQPILTTGVSTPTTTVAKVTVPGMPNSPNVLVPIRNYLQFLPGSRGQPVSVQSPNMSRPTLMPPLPTSLLGRAVTYIMPANSGVGARAMQPILPPPHQQVRLFFQVTNPGTVPNLGTVVNSMSRMQGPPPQPVRSSVPRMTGLPLSQTFSSTPRMSVSHSSQPSANSSSPSGGNLVLFSTTSKHPAPFPKSTEYPDVKGKAIPPKPSLKGSKNPNGIVLSWNMCLFKHHADISSYQLFAYQETDGPVDASLWKKVGDVQALPLPMACTLTQFMDKNRYYFTVRAVDVLNRSGPFSDPVSILYDKDADGGKK